MAGNPEGPALPPDGWITTSDVTAELGMSRTWVWRLVQDGELEARRGTRDRWEISRASLDRYIDRCRMTPVVPRPDTQAAGGQEREGPAGPSGSGA